MRRIQQSPTLKIIYFIHIQRSLTTQRTCFCVVE